MKNIAILASGSGSNAENIIKYFRDRGTAQVVVVATNNPNAYVLERAKSLGVESFVFDREDFSLSDRVLQRFVDMGVDFIVLAGFLWLVPENIIDRYQSKIVNIHPALLPKYGGKGMYGDNVHKAVVAARERQSGITIHYVDGCYDSGSIIEQYCVDLLPEDSFSDVASKVHSLEYRYFPEVIERLVCQG